MAEREDPARTIQRVIDDKYPNTRLIWQSFQAKNTSRPTTTRCNPEVFTRSATVSGTRSGEQSQIPPERLDKVVQRVIDLRYPETRGIWVHSREEPAYLQTAGQRGRTTGLPRLNATGANRPSGP
jgi:hypothetical protein